MDRDLGQTWLFPLHLRRGGVSVAHLLLATGAPPSGWGRVCLQNVVLLLRGSHCLCAGPAGSCAVAHWVTMSRAPAPATTLCTYTAGRRAPDRLGPISERGLRGPEVQGLPRWRLWWRSWRLPLLFPENLPEAAPAVKAPSRGAQLHPPLPHPAPAWGCAGMRLCAHSHNKNTQMASSC